MRTLIRRYTSPKFLHFLYYQHKFNKLFRFYMKRCDRADDALLEAREAFRCLYCFDFTKEIDEMFKYLLG